jgi:hypothetical protein
MNKLAMGLTSALAGVGVTTSVLALRDLRDYKAHVSQTASRLFTHAAVRGDENLAIFACALKKGHFDAQYNGPNKESRAPKGFGMACLNDEGQMGQWAATDKTSRR